MESRIRLDEALVAGAIVRFIFRLGESSEFVRQLLVIPFACRQLGARTLDRSAKFVNLVEPINGHRAGKIAPIGNDAKQVLLLQSDSGLAHRSAAALITLREILLAKGLAGRIDATNDVPFEALIESLAQCAAAVLAGRVGVTKPSVRMPGRRRSSRLWAANLASVGFFRAWRSEEH